LLQLETSYMRVLGYVNARRRRPPIGHLKLHDYSYVKPSFLNVPFL